MTRLQGAGWLVLACIGSSCALDVGSPTDVAGEEAALSYDPGSGYTLAWADEFEGTSLDTRSWTALTSNYDPVTNNCNFGTGELEYPRAQNVSVTGGRLVISAQRTSDAPYDARCAGYGARSFYSGRIHTKGKVEKTYGKIVASIKIPSGYGMWPAFWTLGANVSSVGWPAAGEIDIMEWNSNEPTWMKSATHWYNGGQADWGTGQSGGYGLADGFHLYEVEWTSTKMVFKLDNTYVGSTYYHNESEFQQNHYLILNLALGGGWYGNPAPSAIDLASGVTKTMEVEWIRWYQPTTGTASVTLTNPGFESGTSGWSTYSPNGTASAAFTESYGGAHGGSLHLTHWSSAASEAWTYQIPTGLASGSYKVRAWVKKGGPFDIARLQVKTCASCAPVYLDLGTYGSYTQVETPAIAVTGGTLELGLHTKTSVASGEPFVHLDDVELIRL